jgi:hypothetical protein
MGMTKNSVPTKLGAAAATLALALGAAACSSGHAADHSKTVISSQLTSSHHAAHGSLVGLLAGEGGTSTQAAEGPWGIPGHLFLSSPGERTITLNVGRNGKFSARIPVGTYTVTASSPYDDNWSGNHMYGYRSTVVVHQGATTSLTFICFAVP